MYEKDWRICLISSVWDNFVDKSALNTWGKENVAKGNLDSVFNNLK